MDNLPSEHLHLLLDDPIYILPDHGDHPVTDEAAKSSTKAIENAPIAFEGKNTKGIAIYIEDEQLTENDRIFLFKGLNALDLSENDVALITGSLFADAQQSPKHTIRLEFSAKPGTTEYYCVTKVDNVAVLRCQSLSQIQANKDLKVKFWLSLKALIGKS